MIWILTQNLIFKTMNKDLKSILISLSIVLLYFYAAAGVIKIIWNSKKENVFDARVSFISVMMFIGTLFMLIASSIPFIRFTKRNWIILLYYYFSYYLPICGNICKLNN
jgi:hypothetical protein